MSLLATNRRHIDSIHLILSNVPASDIRALSECVADNYQLPLSIIEVQDELTEGIEISGHWTIATYLKIFLGDLLPPHLAMTLFLDSDVVVVGDLFPLAEMKKQLRESEEAVICAVAEDYDGRHLHGAGFLGPEYFNAGVMLINLDRWRDLELGGKLKEVVVSAQGELQSHDQDALNLVLEGAWQKLPQGFNELRRIPPEPDTTVIHFASADKPWKAGNRHPARFQYKRYRNQTPFPYKAEFDAQNIYRNLIPPGIRRRLNPVVERLRRGGFVAS